MELTSEFMTTNSRLVLALKDILDHPHLPLPRIPALAPAQAQVMVMDKESLPSRSHLTIKKSPPPHQMIMMTIVAT